MSATTTTKMTKTTTKMTTTKPTTSSSHPTKARPRSFHKRDPSSWEDWLAAKKRGHPEMHKVATSRESLRTLMDQYGLPPNERKAIWRYIGDALAEKGTTIPGVHAWVLQTLRQKYGEDTEAGSKTGQMGKMGKTGRGATGGTVAGVGGKEREVVVNPFGALMDSDSEDEED